MLMGNFIVELHKVKQNWADRVIALLSPVNCKFVLQLEFQLRSNWNSSGLESCF